MKTLQVYLRRSLGLSIGLTLVFNGLLFACLLFRPGAPNLVVLIDNSSQAIGPSVTYPMSKDLILTHNLHLDIVKRPIKPAVRQGTWRTLLYDTVPSFA